VILQIPGIAEEDQGVFLVVLSLIGVALAALALAVIYFWATGRQAQRRFELKLIEERLAPEAPQIGRPPGVQTAAPAGQPSSPRRRRQRS